MSKASLESAIIEFLQTNARQAFNYKQVAYGIGATQASRRNDVIDTLEMLAEADSIMEVSLGKYQAKIVRPVEAEGIFVRRSNGRNAVIVGRPAQFDACPQR